jgi:hypothetical protein
VRAATALAEPFRGSGQVVPKLALELDPRLGLASHFVSVLLFNLREVRSHRASSRARHPAVIETKKTAKNQLKKRRATTTTHHAVGSRHRDDVVRWHEAFCSLSFSVFSKFNKQCIKQSFIQDHLLFLTALQGCRDGCRLFRARAQCLLSCLLLLRRQRFFFA